LIAMLAKARPEQREELRGRLRVRIAQLVSGLWAVIVRRGKKCLCGVQLWFRGSERRRDYLILHVPGTRDTGGRVIVRSLASAAAPGDLDLRKRTDAKKLEAALGAVDLEALADDKA